MNAGRYIPVQGRGDHDSADFVIRSGPAINITDAIFKQDGGRSTDLEPFTLLSRIAAGQEWRAFVDEGAVDGTAIPQGIYTGPAIPAADIVAGDVPDLCVLIADAWFDENRLIIENSKTLETVITIGTTDLKTVRDHLRTIGLIPFETSTSSGGEN